MEKNNDDGCFESFGNLIWLALIIGVVIYGVKHFSGSNTNKLGDNISYNTIAVDTVSHYVKPSNTSNNTYEQQNNSESNTNNKESYSTESSEAIDNMISELGLSLSETDNKTLKTIYSDPNPDPDNKEGTICSTSVKQCKWCSNSISVDKKYMTYTTFLHTMTNPVASIGLGVLGTLGGSDKISDLFHQICNSYRNGVRYECEEESGNDFCSNKCQAEYKIYKR